VISQRLVVDLVDAVIGSVSVESCRDRLHQWLPGPDCVRRSSRRVTCRGRYRTRGCGPQL